MSIAVVFSAVLAPAMGADYQMTIIPKLRAPWFNRMDVGAQKAAKELGVKVNMQAPASADEAEQVRLILSSLPARDQRLLRAMFLEEKDKDEICREFGIDRDYFRVLFHRAKDKFRTFYEKRERARPSSPRPAYKANA